MGAEGDSLATVAFAQHHIDIIKCSDLCKRPKVVFILAAANSGRLGNVQVASLPRQQSVALRGLYESEGSP